MTDFQWFRDSFNSLSNDNREVFFLVAKMLSGEVKPEALAGDSTIERRAIRVYRRVAGDQPMPTKPTAAPCRRRTRKRRSLRLHGSGGDL